VRPTLPQISGQWMPNLRVTLILITGLSLVLGGCGSTAVAPQLLVKPGVVTVMGGSGYPVLSSITVIRSNPSGIDNAALCARRGVDGIEANPVRDGIEVQASGSAAFLPPPPSISKTFRYTLTVRTGNTSTYVFNRIRYVAAGPIGAIEGVGAEDAYREMEAVADRVNSCILSQS